MTPPILLTGIHRSGTTWVGRMLEHAPRVRYLYEPLNNEHPAEKYGQTMPTSYTYICRENSSQFQPYVDHVLRGTWKNQVKQLVQAKRILWKDPHALFSAPWLAETYGMSVVVMIRHPAAFVLSIIDKNWPYDFSNLTRQPLLMQQVLAHRQEEVEAAVQSAPNLIDQGILLWNLVYGRVHEYQSLYPHWYFLKHEDMAQDPVAQFGTLYKKLGLPFTEQAKHAIIQHSKAGQPIGAEAGKNSLQRDSGVLVNKWKTRLTHAQIQQIVEGTRDVAEQFYGPSDW